MRPRALRPGDLLAVCAPSGAVDREALLAGCRELERLGFRVRADEGLFARDLFMAGPVERRLGELHEAYADDAVAGVVCARGGAGASWLLPRLDLDLLAARPKVLLGYSDVTLLHLALNARRQVTFHGPMIAHELATGRYDPESFWSALAADRAPSRVDGLGVLRPGTAVGRLRGGCLSLLAAAAGTPWALATEGEDTLLFIEDVAEKPFRIDRMLFQLRNSGALDHVVGIVFGEMKGCAAPEGSPFTLAEVLQRSLAGLGVPVAFGLSSGHTDRPNVTLPFGVPARLTCEAAGRLEMLEAAVS